MTALEACNLPAPAAQFIYKKQTFWRAEKEVDAIRRIGCRIVNCPEPGTQIAERMGRELVIVSGLARGVDALAHDGATSVGGRAIGVLGTGVDVGYP